MQYVSSAQNSRCNNVCSADNVRGKTEQKEREREILDVEEREKIAGLLIRGERGGGGGELMWLNILM